MKQQIVILTISYPYGFKEPFLEEEILYLSRKFETVYIAPLSQINNNDRIRDLPENCRVIQLIANQSLLKTVLQNIRGNLGVLKDEIFYLLQTNMLDGKKIKLVFQKWKETVYYQSKLQNLSQEIFTKKTLFYSYWSDLWLTSLLSLASLKKHKINVVSRAHGYDLYHERTKENYLPFKHFNLKHIQYQYPVSNHGTAYLKKLFPDFTEKIKTQYLGVRALSLLPDNTHIQSKFHIVSCSSIIELKRVEKIAEALQCSVDNIQWTHLGGGPLEKELRQVCHKLPPNISYHITGQLEHSEILEFYKQTPIDLFINVSKFEGLPVSVMEAISVGCTLIITDVGGSKELAQPEYAKVLKMNFETVELTQAINYFIQMPKSDLAKAKLNAKRYFNEKFNSQTNYNDFSNQLLELL